MRTSGVGLKRTVRQLLRNNGDGTFADVTAERGLGVLNTVAVTASDLNNDRAIDLVLTGQTVAVFINPREGVYKTLDAFKPAGACRHARRGRVRLRQGRVDGSGLHASAARLACRCGATSRARRSSGSTLPPSPITSGFGLTAIDYDNDGWIDLAATGATQRRRRAAGAA